MILSFYNIKVSHNKCSKCGYEYYDIYNSIIHTVYSNESSHTFNDLFNKSISDKSISIEKTLYLKKWILGLNLLWNTLPI